MGDTVNVTEESDEMKIKIKRLYSETYNLRVRKNISIITLKEVIGLKSGVVSGLQHLLFRGRVLEDDRFLSDYHVEEGHTLYLVVRTSIPLRASSNAAPGPILSRVHGHRYRLQPSRNSNPRSAFPVAFELMSRVWRERLRHNDASNSQPSGVSMGDGQDAERDRRILSIVRQRRRQLLIGEITECLHNISMLLVDGVNHTDPSSLRMPQGRAVESDMLLQNLGNSLVELGRGLSRFSMGERSPSEPRLQTTRNLPLAAAAAAAPTNVYIRMHIHVEFYWPSPIHQLTTDVSDGISDHIDKC
ncbi:unnamed protein product [Cochlearia groenlandica]